MQTRINFNKSSILLAGVLIIASQGSHLSLKAQDIAYTENIIPVFNIDVKVKVDTPPSSVKLMPENQDLAWNASEDGLISIKVPKLEIYSIVVIE
jgi:hypothetical protein